MEAEGRRAGTRDASFKRHRIDFNCSIASPHLIEAVIEAVGLSFELFAPQKTAPRRGPGPQDQATMANPQVAMAFGIAGSITSTAMYGAPVLAVYRARKADSLGVSSRAPPAPLKSLRCIKRR